MSSKTIIKATFEEWRGTYNRKEMGPQRIRQKRIHRTFVRYTFQREEARLSSEELESTSKAEPISCCGKEEVAATFGSQ